MTNKFTTQTNMRDVLMNKAYFDDLIQFTLDIPIKRSTQKAKASPGVDPKFHAQYIFIIFREHYELMIQKYSRGDALSDIKDFFPETIAAWEWAYAEENSAYNAEELANRRHFTRNLDMYVICLWLLSLAICLDVDDALLARLLALCGNEGEDWLFERIAAARVPGRRAATTLCYPKTYAALRDAILETDRRERDRLMKRFLTGWYPSLGKAYWHDCHKGTEGGGYFGYWCFEAAGAVRACPLDDSAFCDMPHYPGDLAAA